MLFYLCFFFMHIASRICDRFSLLFLYIIIALPEGILLIYIERETRRDRETETERDRDRDNKKV